ncbi:ABC transporter ATP-binding protein [Actinomyces sp. MRS3W]|uniref:ABC transporter ATP-binding protein n=1 Tax=Actinomyces sp. MRS3W TaxID=2800796 RepID=UPI0028FD0E32|nr:ABC transporter ATP-binding protein [Actinomyces sp. MRS3W]MDU0347671.1 ABC transporter ATP-binding protein [Actinomyces sp. MRS3W]
MDSANSAASVANDVALSLEGVDFSYGDQRVLRDVSLTVPAGRSVAIVGPSGSGKSTLLSIVLGLLKPDAGRIRMTGKAVEAGLSGATSRLRRETVGMVFQSGYLLDELSPVENVMLPALAAGVDAGEARGRAERVLSDLGLAELERPVGTYSGGEQQRVAIGRALVNSPKLLVADEPTASLDPDNRQAVVDLLLGQASTRGCGILLVTHDLAVAERADAVLRLADGRLEPQS